MTADLRPRRVIEPPAGWVDINVRELWAYRELLGFLTWRDVKVRYKQTVIGFLWAFLQPFIRLVVFSLVFGRMANMGPEGIPYPVFLYAGLLPWQFFAEALNRSSQSVVGGANLVSKVYFPRLVIPVAAVGSCLVDFAISFTILIGLMLYYGIVPTVGVLAVIPLVACTIVVALSVGILLSALNVAFRDFRYVIPFGIQIWMYLSPVLYGVDKLQEQLPARWGWLVAANPMAGLIGAYRAALLGRAFDWVQLGLSMGIVTLVLLVGVVYFRRLEHRFADII